MRHARRVAPAAVRVGPGWIVGGLLVAAILQAGMVTGDRESSAPPTAAPIAAISPRPTPTPRPTARAPVATPPATPRSTPPLAAGVAALPFPTSAATPTPTPRATPKPTPRPTARPKAAPKPTPKPTARPKAAPKPTPRPTPKPTPRPTPAIVYENEQAGRAAWGRLDGRVVTRLPAGTRIKVCGELGCWEGTSSGYGPEESTGYLLDLDIEIFERICGPRGVGVADVVLHWR